MSTIRTMQIACFAVLLSSEAWADTRMEAAERTALFRAGNAESALFQRANIQLIAPAVRRQIQDVADEIAVANGANRPFRIFIANGQRVSAHSSANGDIFLTSAFLDMLENRDELAFALSREIGLQMKNLRLKEMKDSLKMRRKKEYSNLVFSLVIGSAVGAAYGHYILSPIHGEVMRATGIKPTPLLIGEKDVTAAVDSGSRPVTKSSSPGPRPDNARIGKPNFFPRTPQAQPQRVGVIVADPMYQSTWKSVGNGINDGMSWVPNLVNSKILGITSHLIDMAFEDADPERRRLKDELGIALMQAAGYDGACGQNVIAKFDKFKEAMGSTNVPAAKNEFK